MGMGGLGWGPPPHCLCHINSQLLMTNEGSSLLMSLQLSTPNDQWGWGGWGSSSSLLMSLQLSTPVDQWGGELIAAQQCNITDFHHFMPAQLKLVLAEEDSSVCFLIYANNNKTIFHWIFKVYTLYVVMPCTYAPKLLCYCYLYCQFSSNTCIILFTSVPLKCVILAQGLWTYFLLENVCAV